VAIAPSKYFKLITLTVSEKAYHCNLTRDGINLDSADVNVNIADLGSLLTFPAQLLDRLAARFERG